MQFFAIPAFSSDSLKCLTEIASIPNNPPNPKSLQLQFEMINGVLDRLFHLIPPGTGNHPLPFTFSPLFLCLTKEKKKKKRP